MGTYNTSDFRKGLKVQIDGVPYLMVEMNFRKPGKGNALYECKLKNLIRGTTESDISNAIKKWFDPKDLLLVMVGEPQGVKPIKTQPQVRE